MMCELAELGYDVLPWRVMNVVCELGELWYCVCTCRVRIYCVNFESCDMVCDLGEL